MQPATLPTLGTRNTSLTSAVPSCTSSNSGLSMPLSAGLDLVDRLVDDRVVPDVDALALGELAHPSGWPHVEADDDRVGGDGEVDVVLRDRTDAAADHPQVDLVADVDLEQRVLQRLHRAGDVALDDEQELFLLPALSALSRSSSVTRRGRCANWALRSRASRRSAICLATRSS